MMPSLEIITPKNLNDALNLLSSKEKDIHIIAGGTDVVPGLNQESNRFKDIRLLIDINRIAEVKGIKTDKEKISIGAAETFSDVLQNETVEKKFPLLWKAVSTIGSVQIRNRATIAGNFVNNAPCADTVPVLLVYN
ncbi:MAG: FAD binding domain-containing protein, partial [Melioribacteraceae bacterium]